LLTCPAEFEPQVIYFDPPEGLQIVKRTCGYYPEVILLTDLAK